MVLIGSIIITVPIAADAIVKGWTPPEEQSLSPEASGNNPLKIVIVPSEDNEESKLEQKTSNYPDLGSEQVFPFEPGLGSSQ